MFRLLPNCIFTLASSLSPTVQILYNRNPSTPCDDPFDFFIPIIHFLMLGVGGYEGKVSLFQDLFLAPSF